MIEWREWFKRNGYQGISEQEEQRYQAFKSRLIEELGIPFDKAILDDSGNPTGLKLRDHVRLVDTAGESKDGQ